MHFMAQFPHPIKLELHNVEGLLGSSDGDTPLSALYSVLAGLDTSKVSQLLSVTDGDWEEGLQPYLPLMISTRNRFIKLKFLHWAYCSPVRLSRFYTSREAICPKCSTDTGTFFHMVWLGYRNSGME